MKVIQTAFKGVTLGDGIGLREANGLDDYASAEERKKLRVKDEKHDCAAISVDELNGNWRGLSYFDAAGMRFHLPAFLIADLQGALTSCDMLFTLTFDDPYTWSRFQLLDQPQRRAIREFLKLRLSDMNYDYQRPMIQAALAGYWAEPNERTE